MYASLKGAAIAALLSIAGLSMAHAQSAPRVYENGSVWSIAQIETKPGMFDDYMSYLNGPWRTIQEARKKAGDVLSYHVLAVGTPRDGEADVILMIQLKNMAVFDRTQEEMDQQAAPVFGNNVKANQAYASRQSMRTERGSLLAREMKFK